MSSPIYDTERNKGRAPKLRNGTQNGTTVFKKEPHVRGKVYSFIKTQKLKAPSNLKFLITIVSFNN